jgi:hypothetical protein
MTEIIKARTLESYNSVIDDLEAQNGRHLAEIEDLGRQIKDRRARISHNKLLIDSLRRKLAGEERANPGILEIARLTRPQIAERLLEKVGQPLGLTELALKMREVGVDMDNKHSVVSLHSALTKNPAFTKIKASGRGKSVWALTKWQTGRE